jgi:hypothetical protein
VAHAHAAAHPDVKTARRHLVKVKRKTAKGRRRSVVAREERHICCFTKDGSAFTRISFSGGDCKTVHDHGISMQRKLMVSDLGCDISIELCCSFQTAQQCPPSRV